MSYLDSIFLDAGPPARGESASARRAGPNAQVPGAPSAPSEALTVGSFDLDRFGFVEAESSALWIGGREFVAASLEPAPGSLESGASSFVPELGEQPASSSEKAGAKFASPPLSAGTGGGSLEPRSEAPQSARSVPRSQTDFARSPASDGHSELSADPPVVKPVSVFDSRPSFAAFVPPARGEPRGAFPPPAAVLQPSGEKTLYSAPTPARRGHDLFAKPAASDATSPAAPLALTGERNEGLDSVPRSLTPAAEQASVGSSHHAHPAVRSDSIGGVAAVIRPSGTTSKVDTAIELNAPHDGASTRGEAPLPKPVAATAQQAAQGGRATALVNAPPSGAKQTPPLTARPPVLEMKAARGVPQASEAARAPALPSGTERAHAFSENETQHLSAASARDAQVGSAPVPLHARPFVLPRESSERRLAPLSDAHRTPPQRDAPRTVSIGRIDVIVEAPPVREATAESRANPSLADVSSSLYLRRL